ncbi:hypothetical protein BST61_g10040 [Cercospora zeina]
MLKRKACATELELFAKRTASSPVSAAEPAPKHAEDASAAGARATEAKHYIAAHRLFNVTELLENILLELPFKDLLVIASRVCKRFKEVLDHSTRIQQALFFQPLPGPEVHFFRDQDRNCFFAVEEHAPKRVHVLRNPFLCGIEHWLVRIVEDGDARLRRVDANKIQAFERPEASWRTMLVSQPPVKSLVFGTIVDSRDGFVVKRDDWMRMGDSIPPKEQLARLYDRLLPDEGYFWKRNVCLPRQVNRVEYGAVKKCVRCKNIGHTASDCDANKYGLQV